MYFLYNGGPVLITIVKKSIATQNGPGINDYHDKAEVDWYRKV